MKKEEEMKWIDQSSFLKYKYEQSFWGRKLLARR